MQGRLEDWGENPGDSGLRIQFRSRRCHRYKKNDGRTEPSANLVVEFGKDLGRFGATQAKYGRNAKPWIFGGKSVISNALRCCCHASPTHPFLG